MYICNIFNILISYFFYPFVLIIYLSLIYLSYNLLYLSIYLLFSAVSHPPSAVRHFTESCIFGENGTQCNSTLFMLAWNVNGFAKKGPI